MLTATSKPQVHGLFDPATWTVTYVVHNGPGSVAAIIDSVLDYDPKSGRTRPTSADKLSDYVTDPGDPRARRPPERRALSQEKTGRPNRHW